MELQEIYDIWPTLWYQTIWGKFLIITAIIIVLTFIALIIKFIYREPNISYTKKAQLELKKLLAKKINNQEDIQSIYLNLTLILKTYIEKRFDKELGLTDLEIVNFLKEEYQNVPVVDQVIIIFQKAQYIKFAMQEEDPDMISNDINSALNFIDLTLEKEKTTKR